MSDEQDIAALNDLLVGVEMDRHSLPDGNAKVEALGRAIARLRGDAARDSLHDVGHGTPVHRMQLTKLAQSKLDELDENGYTVNGVAIYNAETNMRGLVDRLGYVGWVTPASNPAAPEMPPPGKPFVGCQCPSCGEEFAATAAPAPALPEREPAQPNTAQGLYRKFYVRRTDGSDAPGGKHDGCDYFVLDMTHDPFAVAAASAYANAAESAYPRLASDMRTRYRLPAAPAPVAGDAVAKLLRAWDTPPTKAGPDWIEKNARRECAHQLRTALAQDRASQGATPAPCAFRALLAEAHQKYQDSDTAGDVLAWLDERVLETDYAALRTGGGEA